MFYSRKIEEKRSIRKKKKNIHLRVLSKTNKNNEMPGTVNIRKGLNIPLKGKVKTDFLQVEKSKLFSLIPDNFIGVIPKPLVKPDEFVKAGSPIFYHKDNPEIKFASPVSGKVLAINRGERRKILNFVIEADGKEEYVQTSVGDLASLNREQIIKLMLDNGLWPLIIQRPYGVIANPSHNPKSIFISGFDSSPLAPDLNIILKGEEAAFQKGIDVLAKLTEGKIHVGLSAKSDNSFFKQIKNVDFTTFSGPHPAGNVGVQIHHVSPINKGEIVWTIRPEDVAVVGKFFIKGIYDISRVIAIAGSEVKETGYIKTVYGAEMSSLVKGNITDKKNRIISGNVLTGSLSSLEGSLGFYDRMVTVIPEGDYSEFLGWAMPGLKKFSNSRAFAAFLTPKKEYNLDTNYHGAERAFVMTGEYEKVVPMDILPQHLIKAALIEDIDLMENLGIYEVVEEDLALCEFVCTSKFEVQAILRKALDFVKNEMS